MARAALLGGLEPQLRGWRVAEVVERRRETPKICSLVLHVPGWPGHRAGQHVDIRLVAEDGYEAQRSYSIASAPGDEHLVLSVERIEDGEVSTYLVDELRVGDPLELRGPFGGYFVWDPSQRERLLLVGGGSGFVPLMAILRHRAAARATVPTRALFSARTLDDVLYRQELARLVDSDPSLGVTITLTRERPANWTGYTRRIDREMLAEVGFAAEERPLSYVCGPTVFVEHAANVLFAAGHASDRIKTERFGPTGHSQGDTSDDQ